MTDLVTLKRWLSEAEEAYHELCIGQQVVSITFNGRATQYTAANKDLLRDHIKGLKEQINTLENGTKPKRGPFTYVL